MEEFCSSCYDYLIISSEFPWMDNKKAEAWDKGGKINLGRFGYGRLVWLRFLQERSSDAPWERRDRHGRHWTVPKFSPHSDLPTYSLFCHGKCDEKHLTLHKDQRFLGFRTLHDFLFFLGIQHNLRSDQAVMQFHPEAFDKFYSYFRDKYYCENY